MAAGHFWGEDFRILGDLKNDLLRLHRLGTLTDLSRRLSQMLQIEFFSLSQAHHEKVGGLDLVMGVNHFDLARLSFKLFLFESVADEPRQEFIYASQA